MAGLTDLLMQALGGGGLSKIGELIGADEKTAGSAMSAIGPLLTSALAKNASTPDGAQALQKALAKDHDGSILDDLGGFFGDTQAANGAGILGHVLGNKQPTVEEGLAKGTGLDMGQIGGLLKIAAPLVMGLIGKQQKTQGLDADGLSAFLGGERQAEEQASPDVMGFVGKMLDSDRDGSSMDDIMGMMGKLFGKG